MKKRHSNKGFTFIELLIAVAIISVLMLGLSQFIASTVKIYNSANFSNKVQNNAQDTYDRITDSIMQAQSIKVLDKAGVEYAKEADDQGLSPEKKFDYDESNGSIYVMDDSKNKIAFTSANGNTMYSYTRLAPNPDTGEYKDITNIKIMYAGETSYKTVDYYFDEAEGKIYTLIKDNVLPFDIPDSSSPDYADYLSAKKNSMVFASGISSSNMMCSGVKSFKMIADADGNCMGLQIEFENRGKKYTSEGMVKIRNSNVLKRFRYAYEKKTS